MSWVRGNGRIVDELPATGSRLDDGALVLGLRHADAATLAACGFRPLRPRLRPLAPQGHTYDRSATLEADGEWWETWTLRRKSHTEAHAETAARNAELIEVLLSDALVANHAFLTAANSPTTLAALRQVDELTQQVNRLIRLVLGLTEAHS